MTPRTRRSTLRLGAGIALSTALAGCAGDMADDVLPSAADGGSESGSGSDGSAGDDSPFPGVEDGVVAQVEALGEAHEASLRARSGTLVETYLVVGQPRDEATVTTGRVRVDGDRLHAVFTPVGGHGGGDDGREEFYAADGETWMARFSGGEATTVDPDDYGLTEHDLLGRGYLQSALWEATVVGTTADHDDRYVVQFADDEPDGVQEWDEAIAVIDANGLVHRFSRGSDHDDTDDAEGPRHRRDVRLTDLDATTVERPNWIEEA